MARVPRLRARALGAGARPRAARAPARPRPAARGVAAVRREHAVRQHHPPGGAAPLSGEPRPRAAHPQHHPLERHDHGCARQPRRPDDRRPYRDLRLGGGSVRGGAQPLHARPRQRFRGGPHLLAGAYRPGDLRPRIPRGAAERGAARQLPPRAPPGRGAVLLPAPPPDAGLLAVPHRVDGPVPDHGDLPGPVQPLSRGPRPQAAVRRQGLGLHRRRRDGRAGIPRGHLPGRPRAARQPRLRRQLQPAAARRPGARQRQDHPGAGDGLLRGRLERHQGDLGQRLGPAAGQGREGAAGAAHGGARRRPVPEVQRLRRQLPAQPLLRRRREPDEALPAPDRRAHPHHPPRRPRPREGVRRLPRRPRVPRRPFGGARQDHQGVRDGGSRGRAHGGAPAEEARQRGPEEHPHPFRHPPVRRGGRAAGLLPAGGRDPREPVPDRAPPGPRRFRAEPAVGASPREKRGRATCSTSSSPAPGSAARRRP